MADFTPGPPAWNLYVSDGEGNIDFKDRERSGGLWPAADGKVDRSGNVYYTGKVGGKRVIMYQFTPKKQENQTEGSWDD